MQKPVQASRNVYTSIHCSHWGNGERLEAVSGATLETSLNYHDLTADTLEYSV